MAKGHRNGSRHLILAAMGAVLGMLLLDETVVGVAIPTIRSDLSLSDISSHWVINSYLLVFAGLTAAGGKLGDIFGLRALFLCGITIFGLASLACGFADDGMVLITARAAQGVGAAIIFPISLAMVLAVFPLNERGTALGIYSATGSMFLALGPLVGGFLVHVLSWRWIFWVNPPIVAAITWVVLLKWTEPVRNTRAARLDLWGALTLAGGLGMLVCGIMQGPDWGWSDSRIVGLLIAGTVTLTVFVLIEPRIRLPLIDVGLLRRPTVAAGNLTIFTAQFCQMSIVVSGAVYLQQVLEMSPLVAGLALLPGVGAAPFAGAFTGHLADRFGARKVTLVALPVTGISLLWIGLAVDWKNYALLVPAFIGWGAATCTLFSAPRKAVFSAVPADKHGETSGILMTSQILGCTMGVAVCGTIYAATHDFRTVFLATAGLTLACFIVGWFCLDRRNADSESEPSRTGADDASLTA